MLLLRKKKESITHAQHDKRRAGTEAEIFTELLWDSQLTFFTNLGGRQIFDYRIVRCHRECLVGISCHGESGYFKSSTLSSTWARKWTTSHFCLRVTVSDKLT